MNGHPYLVFSEELVQTFMRMTQIPGKFDFYPLHQYTLVHSTQIGHHLADFLSVAFYKNYNCFWNRIRQTGLDDIVSKRLSPAPVACENEFLEDLRYAKSGQSLI